ncbi:NAD(P)H-dependent oxidoreductase [Psychroserpens sp.]|uniref:NAD(P)H-dependent oxidoreductase n=1 Tax=Psychroserpens sp. TaxID=2020870 RepID=UPI001B03D4F4|nr:NAD(P)H-dependent oxidoreductase [Psychroserpens sp.]MBO6607474.1 NAD(P)H-dependent oxidoreductase [Psychroserpens sp.]MBO6654448.1 NAD(P)H-dependent oxidoreductase [Psychroserpens sp.]MBO6681203.1 NAD(P)H-dependent oxidoreductase [Psychroserpens sp.]MBO6749840.1 NAD(P)H-dependent oxidoreductase [Psychroserpens sp.]MBO6916172.1 NAD(P)H-dependent oxidoreductase [Psychroserpens sp.]
MDTLERLKWRYATKKFDNDKTLSPSQIELLKNAFNLTATSFGLQTVSLIVIADKDVRAQLVPHAFNQNQVVDASHLLILCIQDNIEERDVDNFFDNVKDTRATPDEILDPFRNNLKQMMNDKSVDERQEWSIRQAYIALGNLMTVCAIEQIDACPMEGFQPKEFDTLLGLQDKGLKSVLLLPVGFRAEDDMFADFKKVRKPLHESVIEM